jgi:hypothetical protein
LRCRQFPATLVRLMVNRSGFWTLSEEKARWLIGGQIYFHDRQNELSFFGGQIVDAHREIGGEYPNKIVFKFTFSKDCRDVRTPTDGWSQEMKLVS